jgi:hypothetical protein
MNKINNLINDTLIFKYFREFTTNTAFLFLPLIAEIVIYWFFKVFSPIHLFLFIWLLIQTYFLIKIKNIRFLTIFLINISIPFSYLFIEYIDEWNIINNSIYLLYSSYVLVSSILYSIIKKDNFTLNKFLKPLDIFIKLLLIPIFYYLLDFKIWNTDSSFFVFYFYESNIHSFLLFIFLFLWIIFWIDSYLSVVRKNILDKLLSILHKYSTWIVDEKDLIQSISKWEMDLTTKKMYKAVIFMDIRWFTHWSENNRPEDIAKMLNWFYSVAEELILSYKWVINKYVADEIVFLFDDLDISINYSLELMKKENEYLSWFWLNVWIWINAWILVYGWIWSDLKKEQTVIWDVVNVAARLEWWINQIKIPKNIVPNRYNVNDLWSISLKWKEKNIEIVEILWNK